MLEGLKNTFSDANKKLNSTLDAIEAKRPILRRSLPVIFFVLAMHFIYLYVGIYNHISDRPCSIHSSAQCQRASVALNYYKVDMNFFQPRIQRFNSDDGITGLEFPVIYYTAAILYKCFGFNETYLRIISLLIVSGGLIFLFLLSWRFVKNTVIATLIVCTLMLSPVLMFYGANFMPDAPGLGFTLAAWYFFFRYLDQEKKRDLNLYMFFGAMGALLKAVSIMCFFIVIALLIIDGLKKFKTDKNELLFKNRVAIAIRTLAGIFIVVAWYAYAKWLSQFHGNMSFAMVPVMIEDMNAFNYVITYLKNWTFQYYSVEMYIALVSALVLLIFGFKKSNRLLFTITLLYLLACICYIYLFFYQFAHHDYYFIALIPLVCFLTLLVADLVVQANSKGTKYFKIVFVVLLVVIVRAGLINCRENYAFRFDNREYLGGDYRAYYDLEPKLRALGITRKDKIVSAFDDSYSNSLYFMNQPGYTVENVYQHDTILSALNAPGVKYLVVNDSAKFNKLYPNDFSKKILIIHRGLIVYKLK